jgi:hypothetical protein
MTVRNTDADDALVDVHDTRLAAIAAARDAILSSHADDIARGDDDSTHRLVIHRDVSLAAQGVDEGREHIDAEDCWCVPIVVTAAEMTSLSAEAILCRVQDAERKN